MRCSPSGTSAAANLRLTVDPGTPSKVGLLTQNDRQACQKTNRPRLSTFAPVSAAYELNLCGYIMCCQVPQPALVLTITRMREPSPHARLGLADADMSRCSSQRT